MSEPAAVEVTPFIRAVLEAKATGDDAAVEALIASSSDADRTTFLAWSRRLWWIESEIMATQETLSQSAARLAELDAEERNETLPPV